MNRIVQLAMVLVTIISTVRAQQTTIGTDLTKWTGRKTYSLIDTTKCPVSAADMAMVSWDKLPVLTAEQAALKALLIDPSNLFIIPVVDIIEKGKSNYVLALVAGKNNMVLPKSKDGMGFYVGKGGLNFIASVYVDPLRLNSPFGICYFSALNSVLKYGQRFTSQVDMTEFLKGNYWYEEMGHVHFQKQDMDSRLDSNAILTSVMKQGIAIADSVLMKGLSMEKPEEMYADIMEVYTKAGSSEIHRFFFSTMLGLVYHEMEPGNLRKERVFTKRDIARYGSPYSYGKKID